MRLAIALAFFLATPTSAQVVINEFGYVVVDGERVAGRLSLGTHTENARSVQFRDAEGVQTLGPADIDGYGTDAGRQYRTVRLVADGDSLAAFARVVRAGRADLLSLDIDGAPRLLVALDDGPAVLLPDDADRARAELVPLFTECPEALTGAGSTETITETVDWFNLCMDDAYVTATPEEAGPAPWRPEPGVSLEFGVGVVTGQYVPPLNSSSAISRNETMFGPAIALALAVRPSWSPQNQAVFELRHARGGVRMVDGGPGSIDAGGESIVSLAVTQISAGLRGDVTPTVWIEAGLLAGRTSNSPTVATSRVIIGVPVYAVSNNLGGYLQAAIRPLGPTFQLVARAQFTELSGDAPQSGVPRDRVDGGAFRTATFGARWRFGG